MAIKMRKKGTVRGEHVLKLGRHWIEEMDGRKRMSLRTEEALLGARYRLGGIGNLAGEFGNANTFGFIAITISLLVMVWMVRSRGGRPITSRSN